MHPKGDMKTMCNPSCIYFPQEASEVKEEWIDEFGTKCRKVIRICGYNGKQIDYWEDGFCDWIYKEFQYRITYKDGIVFMLECK